MDLPETTCFTRKRSAADHLVRLGARAKEPGKGAVTARPSGVCVGQDHDAAHEFQERREHLAISELNGDIVHARDVEVLATARKQIVGERL